VILITYYIFYQLYKSVLNKFELNNRIYIYDIVTMNLDKTTIGNKLIELLANDPDNSDKFNALCADYNDALFAQKSKVHAAE
jgi:hypothetical protein